MCHDCSVFLSFTMAEHVVNVINDGNEASETTPAIEATKPLEKVRNKKQRKYIVRLKRLWRA